MGTTRNQITKLESGSRRLSDVWIARAARAFGIDPGALVSDSDAETAVVPLISWVSAGQLATVETVPEGEEADNVVTTNLPPGKWVALRVDGDSMNLVAPDGCKIFVNRDETTLESGGYYVIAEEDGKATFKRYRTNPSRFVPESTNREHEPYFPPNGNGTTVIGRVRKIVHDLG